MKKKLALVCAGAALFAGLSATAAADPRISFGIQIGVPVYSPPPVYYTPPPVYYSPPPVYYAPQPRVYYQPGVVYVQPRHHGWRDREWRHERHNRGRDHDRRWH